MSSICYLPSHLPAEITRRVLEYAKLPDLAAFGATSKLSYEYATDFLWTDLILRDQSKELDLTSDEVALLKKHTIEVQGIEPVPQEEDEEGSVFL
jgi:F-box associated protein